MNGVKIMKKLLWWRILMKRGDVKINFILKWKCSEEELLADLKACETYSEVMGVLYYNMILSIGGF